MVPSKQGNFPHEESKDTSRDKVLSITLNEFVHSGLGDEWKCIIEEESEEISIELTADTPLETVVRQLVEDRKQLIQLLRHLYSKYGVSSGRANRRMGTRLYPRRTNGKQEAQLSKRRARRAAIAKQLDEKRQDTNHNEKPHETHEDVEQ